MIKVTSTAEAKVTVKGTSIEIQEIETRLEVYCPPSGTELKVAMSTYELGGYAAGKDIIAIEGFDTREKIYDLAKGTQPETYDAQSVEVAHTKAIAYLVGLGFTAVEIDMG